MLICHRDSESEVGVWLWNSVGRTSDGLVEKKNFVEACVIGQYRFKVPSTAGYFASVYSFSCTIRQMDKDVIKRRQRELSKQQAMYVANRMRGHTRQESAIMAGYADSEHAGRQVEESPAVQSELAKARAAAAAEGDVTAASIVEGLRRAADMAETMSDPQAMVRAYSELGKFLGLYAPEVKKVDHNHMIDKTSAEAIKALSDAELMRLAHGRVIDSTATEVKE